MRGKRPRPAHVCRAVAATVCIISTTAVLQAAQITINCQQDTYIDYYNPNTNYDGLNQFLYVTAYNTVQNPQVVPRKSALIQFDLSSLHKHAYINSARVSLLARSREDWESGDWADISLFAVNGTRDWVASQATWNVFKTGTYWSTPGCEWVPFDRSGTADATVRFSGNFPLGVRYEWSHANLTSTVWDWHRGAATNRGWLVRITDKEPGEHEGVSFYDVNYGTAWGPQLFIDYTIKPITWNTTNGTWNTTSTNWTWEGGPTQYVEGDMVRFTDTGGGTSASIAIAGTVQPASVTFDNTNKSYAFSSGAIGGSTGITKGGTGTVTMGTANSYTGSTTLNAGSLIVTANGALGASSSGTTVNSGATLGFQGAVAYSTPEPLTINGSGAGGAGAIANMSGDNSFAGPITLGSGSSIGVASGSLTLTGAIDGNHTLTKIGPGTLILGGSSANSHGQTTVNQGTLVLNKSAGAAVPGPLLVSDGTSNAGVRLDASHQIAGSSAVTVNYLGSLELNGNNNTIASLTMTGGSVSTGVGTLTLGGNVAYTGATNAATISGNLDLGGTTRIFQVNDGVAADDLVVSARIANGGLTKTGSGRLVLAGDNTYSGATTIAAGALVAQHANALGGGPVTVGSLIGMGPTLLAGIPLTIANNLTAIGSGATIGGLNTSGEVVFAADVRLDAADLSLHAAPGGRVCFGGNFSESSTSSLKAIGGGVIELTGDNRYSGGTHVVGATLLVNNTSGSGTGNGSVVVGAPGGVGVGGSLGGEGSIAGTVLVHDASLLLPGKSVGTLTVGSLVLSNDSALVFELDRPGIIGQNINDLIAVRGDLTLDGMLHVQAMPGFAMGTYTLFTYEGGLDDRELRLGFMPPGYRYEIDVSEHGRVNLIVIPEPAALSLLALGGLALIRNRRR